LVTLLLQAFKGGAYSWVCSRCRQIFGERKKARTCSSFWKSAHFSLLVAFIPLLNAKGCLDVGPRLSLSPYWVILGLVSIPILPYDKLVQQ